MVDEAKNISHGNVISAVELSDELKNNIQTGIHYPIALPKLKAYEYTNQSKEHFFANKHDTELLSLPIGEHLSKEDLNYIIKIIKSYYGL